MREVLWFRLVFLLLFSMLGKDPVTLRKWESTGELLPARKTKGGTFIIG